MTPSVVSEIDAVREECELSELHKLKINKLESCYNYRTISDKFIVVASVFSNLEKYIPVNKKG